MIKEELISKLLESVNDKNDVYRSYCNSSYERVLNDFYFIKKNLKKTDSFLEIGGTPPLLILMLLESGYTNISILDPFVDRFETFLSINKIKTIKYKISDQELNLSERYDFINFTEVIEHVNFNHVKMILQIKSLLNNNGFLHVTTPNLRSLWGIYALVFQSSGLASKPIDNVYNQFVRESSDYGYYGHLREYTKKEVVDLFEACGFKLSAHEGAPNSMSFNRTNSKLINTLIGTLETNFPRLSVFYRYLFCKV
jgi:2-polyprenyl-3-methyl-5-hydroxy-6-metoxy-1,4-benzoquinol methylase